MKERLFGYTKDRGFILNLVIAILSFIGMFLVPSLIAIAFMNLMDENYAVLIGDIIYIIILFFVFYKDLKKEFYTFFGDFNKNFKKSFKIYLLGFLGMVICNLYIAVFLKNISSNEEQVRQMLYNNVVPTLISISIMAPILEELIFRKSIAPLFKRKWVYIIVSGLLFGGAHILTNIIQGIFVPLDLLYVLPYASLGCAFALMDYDNKSTYNSIMMHSIHNTFTAILLLISYFGGK